MKAPNPTGVTRLVFAMLLPLVAFGLQSMFWAAIQPFAWFLFFPAVFFSSWIGGFSGGVIATVISTALAWWFFIPPEGSFALENPFYLVSIGLFMSMGLLFGYTQERIMKANRKTAEALAIANSANEQLQAANKELEAFSYSVSHDLRAPLRAVDGFSRILLEDHTASLSGDARHYLDLVRNSTQHMGHLIDDLLAFSRLSHQELTRRTIQPASLARQALEQLESERTGRSVEIEIDEMPEGNADPNLLRQVYVNLLSNALKFTRKRGQAHIHIGSRTLNGKLVFFVQDNGVGFDMAYVGKLFGVFQRLHRSEEYEGTGVGLAIVQRIIHRHGGRAWAEGAVDQGATVFFTLPEGNES